MTRTETRTISRRSRNLGYAFNNQPTRVYNEYGDSSLRMERPTSPQVTGGRKVIIDEHAAARRANNGNDWTAQVFVDGLPVVDVHGGFGGGTASRDVVAFLAGTPADYGTELDVVVEVADGN